MLRALMDRTLDFAVVPGYSRIGYVARRADFDPLPRMEGRTVLITGATAGLGRGAAEACAQLGARVLVLARDEGRGRRTVQEIVAATGNPDVELVLGDLSSAASVRTAAADVITRAPALHVLINNAGVMSDTRQLSADGFELTFATNVLGMFLLTELLTPLLRASAPARIVNVTSGGSFRPAPVAGRPADRAPALRRTGGVRAHEARGDGPDGRMGAAAGGHRRRRARHAPGLGRHPRRADLTAALPQRHGAAAAQRAGGGRHDGLAGRGARARPLHGPPVARPAPPRRAPHP
jgi:hypothetical protein